MLNFRNHKSEYIEHGFLEERVRLHGNIARIEVPAKEMPIWLDVSMKRFEYVHPAGGNEFTSAKITPDELEKV